MHTKQANTYNQRLAVGASLGKRSRALFLDVVEDCVRYFDNPGITYFLHAGELALVKIGCTGRGFGRRIQAIQGCCPVDLRTRLMLTGGEALERALHYQFAEWRSRGEWFITDPTMEFLMAQLAYRYASWVEANFPPTRGPVPALERLLVSRNVAELEELGISLPDFTRPNPPDTEENS